MVSIVLRIFPSKSLLRKQKYHWTLSVNGEPIAKSTEGYYDAAEARSMGVAVCNGQYAQPRIEDET